MKTVHVATYVALSFLTTNILKAAASDSALTDLTPATASASASAHSTEEAATAAAGAGTGAAASGEVDMFYPPIGSRIVVDLDYPSKVIAAEAKVIAVGAAARTPAGAAARAAAGAASGEPEQVYSRYKADRRIAALKETLKPYDTGKSLEELLRTIPIQVSVASKGAEYGRCDWSKRLKQINPATDSAVYTGHYCGMPLKISGAFTFDALTDLIMGKHPYVGELAVELQGVVVPFTAENLRLALLAAERGLDHNPAIIYGPLSPIRWSW